MSTPGVIRLCFATIKAGLGRWLGRIEMLDSIQIRYFSRSRLAVS